MDENRFERLLRGEAPTMDDFVGFLSVTEKLPGELLWKALNIYPKMNDVLRSVMQKQLCETVRRENIDNALNAIVTRLNQA